VFNKNDSLPLAYHHKQKAKDMPVIWRFAPMLKMTGDDYIDDAAGAYVDALLMIYMADRDC
jgi:hypothetical protein